MKTLILALALFIAPIISAHAYLTVTPGSIEFGGVKIGTQSSRMFFLNNIGNDDVYVFSCNVFGAFQCQLNCGGILYHGQSCSGMIYFRPKTEHYEFEITTIQTDKGSVSLSVHGSGKL